MKRLILLLIITLFMFCSCNQNIESCNSDSVMYQHLVAVWKESLEPYSCDTAFFGDSRVIGADWVSAYPEYDVVNLGIGGDKVEDLLRRLCLLDALEIKKCFVAIGGNNAISDSFNSVSFEQNYEKLIRELKNRNIVIFLNTIAPITDFGSSSDFDIRKCNNKIEMANDIIRALAEKHSVTLIDIAPVMTDGNGKLVDEYSADGVHFTRKGNQVWFDFVKPFLE